MYTAILRRLTLGALFFLGISGPCHGNPPQNLPKQPIHVANQPIIQITYLPSRSELPAHIIIDKTPRDDYDVLGLVFAGFGTLFSFITAVLVYLFTARQARSETLAAIHGMWQQLNFAILTDTKSLHAYRKLFSVDAAISDEDVRLEYMTFIWVNILYLEWNSLNQKLIINAFAEKSLGDQLIRMVPQRKYLVKLLSERGYDDSFVEFVRSSCERLSKSP